MFHFCGSDMEANLSQLVQRLEAVTSRLEGVSGQSSTPTGTTSAQPMMDSGYRLLHYYTNLHRFWSNQEVYYNFRCDITGTGNRSLS